MIQTKEYLKVMFVSETGGDLVMNVTNKIYFYAYKVNNLSEPFSWNYYNFSNGSIKALKNNTVRNTTTNITTITNTTINISVKPDVSTNYNGLGSFFVTP